MSKKKHVDVEDLALFRELMGEDIEAKLKESIQVFDAETHYDFPSVGKVNTIYKANSEKMLYQWDPDALKYEPLNTGGTLSVKVIHGGNASTN